MNATYTVENENERQRLFQLIARLAPDDFSRALPNGWTVSTKLAHLAFWDLYYLSLVEAWERTGFATTQSNVDAINEAVRALSRSIPQESAAKLACYAAEAIDRKVQTLTPELVFAIKAGGHSRILHRALHRREHLDQIEKALIP
jgi:hypothetical protein